MANLLVIGAGGHSVSVTDALLVSGERVVGIVDANPASEGSTICGVSVIGNDAALARFDASQTYLANGIGGVGEPATQDLRRLVQERLEKLGWSFISVRHPSAIVSPRAEVGEGTHILAGAIVQPGARLGKGVIVNTGAIVEHNAQIGAWSHVAPGAVLCGDVRLGPQCHVGAAAVVRQGVSVGASTTIGAGAVVVKDFLGNGTLVGIPARSRNSEA